MCCISMKPDPKYHYQRLVVHWVYCVWLWSTYKCSTHFCSVVDILYGRIGFRSSYDNRNSVVI
jgi:hypothetical protein